MRSLHLSSMPPPEAIGSSAGGGGGGGGGGRRKPCGACKFIRRGCEAECVFAASFGSDGYSAEQFEVMHRVFGASNMSKLLSQVPPHLRRDAVTTLLYEAQARTQDPVYGCTAHVFALQKQVELLQEELIQVKAQLTMRSSNKEVAVAQASQNQALGMLRSFPEPPLPNNGSSRPPHLPQYYDYNSSAAPVVVLSGFANGDGNGGSTTVVFDHLRRTCSDESQVLVGIQKRYNASAAGSTAEQLMVSQQQVVRQMGCWDDVITHHQLPGHASEASSSSVSLQEQLDELGDWLLLDEQS